MSEANGNIAWHETTLNRVVSRALNRETLVTVKHGLNRLVEQDQAATAKGQTSALDVILSDPQNLINSGLNYMLKSTYPNLAGPGIVKSDVIMFVAELNEMSSVESEQEISLILEQQLTDSFHGADGRLAILKNVRPRDLINNVMVVDNKKGTVERRRVMVLPGLSRGTCECCLSDNVVALLSALRTHLPSGDIPSGVLADRSSAIFKEELMATHDPRLVKSLRDISNQFDKVDNGQANTYNLASVLRPTSEATLISLLCFRIGRQGVVNYSVRLTCKACFDSLQDPKSAYVRIRNAEFVEKYLNHFGNGQEVYKLRRQIETEAKLFSTQVNALRSVTGRHIGSKLEKPILTASELHEDELAELCTELIRMGLDTMVGTLKDGSKVLKRNVTLKEARTALNAVKSASSLFGDDPVETSDVIPNIGNTVKALKDWWGQMGLKVPNYTNKANLMDLTIKKDEELRL